VPNSHAVCVTLQSVIGARWPGEPHSCFRPSALLFPLMFSIHEVYQSQIQFLLNVWWLRSGIPPMAEAETAIADFLHHLVPHCDYSHRGGSKSKSNDATEFSEVSILGLAISPTGSNQYYHYQSVAPLVNSPSPWPSTGLGYPPIFVVGTKR
jgi:hypothetical protein